MLRVTFPPPAFKVKGNAGQEQIWDAFRKKWVRLTPEEWVRQNFIQFLVQEKGYPATLISVEKKITVGEMIKRYDIIVYKNGQPWMIVECKEMKVPLSENVLDQVLRYNGEVIAPFIVITNGREHFAWQIKGAGFQAIAELPQW